MNVMSMLFGAALVAIGVLAGAFADRIRGTRRERTKPGTRTDSISAWALRNENTGKFDAAGHTLKTDALKAMAQDVISALTTSGYSKAVASEATWRCRASERSTLESWIRAASKNCLRTEVQS